jgi:hypothetical protein
MPSLSSKDSLGVFLGSREVRKTERRKDGKTFHDSSIILSDFRTFGLPDFLTFNPLYFRTFRQKQVNLPPYYSTRK